MGSDGSVTIKVKKGKKNYPSRKQKSEQMASALFKKHAQHLEDTDSEDEEIAVLKVQLAETKRELTTSERHLKSALETCSNLTDQNRELKSRQAWFVNAIGNAKDDNIGLKGDLVAKEDELGAANASIKVLEEKLDGVFKAFV